jgi:AN1-like Zinc finger.
MGKKVRCTFCNKKVGLVHYTCACQGIFCSLHRYTHSHNCTFKKEKQEENKKKIQDQNPKTESSTLDKIK